MGVGISGSARFDRDTDHRPCVLICKCTNAFERGKIHFHYNLSNFHFSRKLRPVSKKTKVINLRKGLVEVRKGSPVQEGTRQVKIPASQHMGDISILNTRHSATVSLKNISRAIRCIYTTFMMFDVLCPSVQHVTKTLPAAVSLARLFLSSCPAPKPI